MAQQTWRVDILSVPTIPGSISFPLKTCALLLGNSPSICVGVGGNGLVKVEAEPTTFRLRVDGRPAGSKGWKLPGCWDLTACIWSANKTYFLFLVRPFYLFFFYAALFSWSSHLFMLHKKIRIIPFTKCRCTVSTPYTSLFVKKIHNNFFARLCYKYSIYPKSTDSWSFVH